MVASCSRRDGTDTHVDEILTAIDSRRQRHTTSDSLQQVFISFKKQSPRHTYSVHHTRDSFPTSDVFLAEIHLLDPFSFTRRDARIYVREHELLQKGAHTHPNLPLWTSSFLTLPRTRYRSICCCREENGLLSAPHQRKGVLYCIVDLTPPGR